MTASLAKRRERTASSSEVKKQRRSAFSDNAAVRGRRSPWPPNRPHGPIANQENSSCLPTFANATEHGESADLGSRCSRLPICGPDGRSEPVTCVWLDFAIYTNVHGGSKRVFLCCAKRKRGSAPPTPDPWLSKLHWSATRSLAYNTNVNRFHAWRTPRNGVTTAAAAGAPSVQNFDHLSINRRRFSNLSPRSYDCSVLLPIA
jgi:hypothetical protein